MCLVNGCTDVARHKYLATNTFDMWYGQLASRCAAVSCKSPKGHDFGPG